MTTQKLKIELIEWLSNLNNKKLLKAIVSLKDSEQSGDWYETLSANQKKSLKRGIEDHRKGRTLTSKQFWQRYEN